MNDVTLILNAVEAGEPCSVDRLLSLVYDELRRLAAHKLRHEPPGQTLQATALVHEAYLRLLGNASYTWQSRAHFFGAAAEAMRRILVDNARRKRSLKRGRDRERVELEEHVVWDQGTDINELLALDDALGKLAEFDPVKAELVKLRYFAGLTADQAAKALGMARSTALEHWAFARAWLRAEMSRGEEKPGQRAYLRDRNV